MAFLRFQVHYRLAQVRYWFREKLPFRIALWLPRRVALWAFIRVCAVLDHLGPDFHNAYIAFERGEGK